MDTKYSNTHSRILQIALELFSMYGYENTTLKQIAKSAQVTEMTLYRHFKNKEELVLFDPYDEMIARSIIEQPKKHSALQATLGGIRMAWKEIPPPLEAELRQRVVIISTSKELRAALPGSMQATEQAIIDALTVRKTPVLEAKTVAAATLAALSTALFEWVEADETKNLGPVILETLSVLEPNV